MSAAAAAQVLNDPTRPPAELGTAAEAEGGGPVLQSVMISPTHKAAIISGEMVRLGEKFGDAVLVRVAENEVELRSGGDARVLKMYPGVEKREAAAGKGAQQRARKGRSGGGSAAPGDAPRGGQGN